MIALGADFQMWVVLALTGLVVLLYVTEWISLELTSLAVLAGLLLFFHLFPLPPVEGGEGLTPARLLAGFSNPALLTVLALLVVGEGLVRTGALESLAGAASSARTSPATATIVVLIGVAVLSAFLNNTPVVVIFIPLMQALARRLGQGAGRLMIPLSYTAIIGGMTTLIGSSTNLLVSSAMIDQGMEGFSFFEFTPIALVMAVAGLAYVIFVLPKLLPNRSGRIDRQDGQGKQFISQIVVPSDSVLNGEKPVAGQFRSLPEATVRMILRNGEVQFPLMDEDFVLHAGDIVVIAATRPVLADIAARHPGAFHPPKDFGEDRGRDRLRRQGLVDSGRDGKDSDEMVLVELMLPPSSRMCGRSLAQSGFVQTYRAIVAGVQRRARMVRARMTEIRLEAGDVLLVMGREDDIERIRQERDLVVLSGTQDTLLRRHHAARALAIFAAAIGSAALGWVPITVAAIGAATLMIITGCLNLHQAGRALDRKILLVVAAALALGESLASTGAAAYVAQSILGSLGDASPWVVMSVLFLLVSLFTNILTNNACAVLFTPIAIGLAHEIGADPHSFAIAVVLAANCSFATPIGYQTNLLVMAPGQYQFVDFIKAGLPLVLVMWAVFSVIAPLFLSL
ncbi:MAG: SLC13 family permease [Rhodospirillaceae bacterium]